jgi:hypothetical protein
MLVRWKAEVVPNYTALPQRRFGLRYTLEVRCYSCGTTDSMQSPIWHLLDRNPEHTSPVLLGAKHNTIKFNMVIYCPKTGRITEVIDWMILRSVGHESRNLANSTWNCSNCGMVFGLTAKERERLKREMPERVTLSWLEQEIMRLEPNLPGTEVVAGNRRWRMQSARVLLESGS